MRAAFGGEIEPERALPIATGLIERALRQCAATHLIVALDSSAPSWRRELYPDYKANRTRDTSAWLKAGFEGWGLRRWYVVEQAGFEADDLIATLAHRARQHFNVVVVSQDSDLLPLAAWENVTILRPANGGKFDPITPEEVCGKYQITHPRQLADFKALTGESGDNVPGVPGIGPMKAARMLARYETVEGTIASGAVKMCKDSIKVAEHAETARLALRLVTLRSDVPIGPIHPHECFLQ